MPILPLFCVLTKDLFIILLQMKREIRKAAGSIWTQEKMKPCLCDIRAGNENFWFSTSLDNGMWYCSEPGYRNIRSMSGVNGLLSGGFGS